MKPPHCVCVCALLHSTQFHFMHNTNTTQYTQKCVWIFRFSFHNSGLLLLLHFFVSLSLSHFALSSGSTEHFKLIEVLEHRFCRCAIITTVISFEVISKLSMVPVEHCLNTSQSSVKCYFDCYLRWMKQLNVWKCCINNSSMNLLTCVIIQSIWQNWKRNPNNFVLLTPSICDSIEKHFRTARNKITDFLCGLLSIRSLHSSHVSMVCESINFWNLKG